jgi:four helix bundle protein
MEVETFLILATRLGYITESETATAQNLIVEVGKMLSALRTKLNNQEIAVWNN